jgi:two-component system chemotaxis response regulator CheB
VVDDSAVVRQAVALAVARAADIELVATAADPLFAMERCAGAGRT